MPDVAMWTHGHSIRIEQSDRIETVWRAGYYASLKGRAGRSAWVHFSIPTPAIFAERTLRLDSILVRFQAPSTDAWIKDVHIYDGNTRIQNHDLVNDSADSWDNKRYSIENRPVVHSAVGVSLNLEFTIDGVATPSHTIKIAAVGGDFVYSDRV